MITSEQIEAQINDLRSEIDRRVAAVRATFAEAGELRSEADLLKRLLILRSKTDAESELISLVFVGYVRNESEAPKSLCALTWSGSREVPADPRIFVKREWRSLLPDGVLSYFSDLFADWKDRIRRDPAALISAISGLSVGPVRTAGETTVRKRQLPQLLNERLGDTSEYPVPALLDER